MRLENCVLDVHQFRTAPFQRKEPEEDWVQASNSQIIPSPLFSLYTKANYLSFGSAPLFLSDGENVLFSYFSMILRGTKESLVGAEEQLRLFAEAERQGYDPGKKFRGESWDTTADQRARRHFRYFLISLQSALDVVADLAALLLTGLIPGLRLGRAQFKRIEDWLAKPLPPVGVIVSPQQHFSTRLYEALRPLVHPQPPSPERHWLPLMRMLRNKAAHFGDPVFRTVGLHDKELKFFAFVPRMWPYIWEKHIKPAGAASPRDANFLPNLCRQTLMHQDVISYTQGLLSKVRDTVGAATSVLSEAFDQFKDFPVNQAALDELQGSAEMYEFEFFQATGS
jgi:hypothetical protein